MAIFWISLLLLAIAGGAAAVYWYFYGGSTPERPVSPRTGGRLSAGSAPRADLAPPGPAPPPWRTTPPRSAWPTAPPAPRGAPPSPPPGGAPPSPPAWPVRPPVVPPPGAGPSRSTRIRVRSSTPPPYASPAPPRVGTGYVQVTGQRRAGCPYCGVGILPGESFLRCTQGHTQHVECATENAGRCAQPHCPGTVAG